MLRQAYLLPSPPAAPKPSAPANFLPRVQCPLQGQQSNTHIHNWDAKPGLEKGQCRRVTAVTPRQSSCPCHPRLLPQSSHQTFLPPGSSEGKRGQVSSSHEFQTNSQSLCAAQHPAKLCWEEPSSSLVHGSLEFRARPTSKQTWDHFFLLLGKLQEVQSCLLTQDQLRRQ